PNLLIKQGAKLVQDWNDVVVDLPQPAQRRLIDEGRQRLMDQGFAGVVGNSTETSGVSGASDSAEAHLAQPHQQVARRVLAELKPDQAIQLDNLLEKLEGCSPSEVIPALFELEI